MSICVVKLGSTLVADERGEVRDAVLREICGQVAELCGRGPVVMVTSGAIARGMRLLGCRCARGRWTSCRPPRRSARATSSALTRAAWPSTAGRSGPGAADRRRHRRPHQLPERAPDAAAADRVGRRAGGQRERHHRDRRDQLRRQRLPRRPGRDAARRAAAGPAHERRRRSTPADPRADPDARLVAEVADFAELERTRDRRPTSAFGSGGMRSKVAAAEMASEAGIPA